LPSFSENYFFSDPELNDSVPIDFLSHKEKYEEAVRKACIVYKKSQEVQKVTGEMDISR
jgi:acyl-CoA oxidase